MHIIKDQRASPRDRQQVDLRTTEDDTLSPRLSVDDIDLLLISPGAGKQALSPSQTMSTVHPAPAGMEFLKKPKSKQAHGTAPRYTLDNGIHSGELADQSQGECECQEDFYDDEDVDDSVREDMDKLEDSFPGVSDRFRLVNRIGEGINFLNYFFPYERSFR